MGGALALVVAAELARQALGPDALQLIDNVLRHEPPPPFAEPALVRGLLARPLDAADARGMFERTIPRALADLSPAPGAESFDALLERYLEELAAAQRVLRDATRNVQARGMPSPGELESMGKAVDAQGIERANALFVEATARFARAVQGKNMGEPRTFESAIGTVVIGSRAGERHRAAAALIVDPGGDDAYEQPAAASGTFRVILDLAGDDRYRGGLAAAVGGGALLIDFAGNDTYESDAFGQGAAAFGFAALVDAAGDDEYRVGAWGQGFALAGGVGLLWDRGGNDRYFAEGTADPFNRGRLSGAQGAAFGTRTIVPGGVGILRDEGGDDRYEAQMFAQGSGYYYGIGLLWDERGDDRYRALRYAQGSGAHQAAGVLRDESGSDRYELGYGVGQGMGLDLALGLLIDAAGDDRYAARFYAQGSATANGLGMLHDAAGADRLRVEHGFAWGNAEPLRGLPSVGLLLAESGKALFERIETPMEEKPSGATASCAAPDLAVRREHFDALVAAGEALQCRLRKGELWSDAETLLANDPADAMAAWIAPALASAPDGMREKLREILWRHPSCGVRASSLDASRIEAALKSSCWRLQAAALRLGAAPAPGASLPGFLRARPAY